MPSADDKRVTGRWFALASYARSHNLLGLAVGLLFLTGCDAAFGSQLLSFPFEHGGQTTGVPMRRELPIAFASLAAGSLHSKMRQLELAGATTLRSYESRHLMAVYTATTVLVGGTELIVNGAESSVLLIRALLIWLGLAVLSGRIFGRSLSWILPVATIFPLTYLGQDETGRDRWWDWTGQSAFSVLCWSLAICSTIVGLAAFYLTPWHIQWVRRIRLSTTQLPAT